MRTATSNRDRQVLKRVGENLFRDEASGIYYLIYKQAGKQIRRSLKTTDAALARRKRDDDLRKLKQLDPDAKDLIFTAYDDRGKLVGGLANDWFEFAQLNWKPSVIARETYAVKELSRHFGHQRVRRITAKMVQTWAKARTEEVGPDSFNRERLRLIHIFDYAIEHKQLLENPAAHIPKLKAIKHVSRCPSETEFATILADMRSNDGKRDGRDSANLCEGLTYIGCRKGDAEYPEWRHIYFTAGKFTITGHPRAEQKIMKDVLFRSSLRSPVSCGTCWRNCRSRRNPRTRCSKSNPAARLSGPPAADWGCRITRRTIRGVDFSLPTVCEQAST
jgi:hypothetical protein